MVVIPQQKLIISDTLQHVVVTGVGAALMQEHSIQEVVCRAGICALDCAVLCHTQMAFEGNGVVELVAQSMNNLILSTSSGHCLLWYNLQTACPIELLRKLP